MTTLDLNVDNFYNDFVNLIETNMKLRVNSSVSISNL